MIYYLAFGIALFLFSGGVAVAQVFDESKYDELFKKYANKYGLDWKMLKAIAKIESSLGRAPSVMRGLLMPTDVEGSKSTDGKSWGLMQVTLPTAQDYEKSATPILLNNPDYSVWIAARHLKMLEGLFNRSDLRFREWVIKSYNQGQGNTKKEMDGKISGYANSYWLKYKSAYNSIDGL